MEELTHGERALLAAYCSSEGFHLVNEIMKDEVQKFNVALLNESDPAKIVIAHNLASAAAKFYQGVINRINSEAFAYKNTPQPGDAPIDMTAGLLDV